MAKASVLHLARITTAGSIFCKVLVISLFLFLSGCSESTPIEQPARSSEMAGIVKLSPESIKKAGIEITPAKTVSMASALSVPGDLQPREDALVVVNVRTAGEVQTLSVRVGEPVRLGQTLALIVSLDLAQAQADYQRGILAERQAQSALQRLQSLSRITRDQVRTRLETARREFDREKNLFEKGISSRRDYEAAQATLRQRELELGEAEVNQRDAERGVLVNELAKARQTRLSAAERIRLLGGSLEGSDGLIPVRSPITGRIAAIEVALGQAVAANAALFKVVNVNQLVAVLETPEGSAQFVKPGTRLSFKVDALPGRKFSAQVTSVGDIVDESTRKLPVRCAVNNADGLLKAGMFISATLPTAMVNYLVVPNAAVQTIDNKPVVFVALEKGRFASRAVVSGQRVDGQVAILKGLKPGESVVSTGAFWIKSELQKSQLEE